MKRLTTFLFLFLFALTLQGQKVINLDKSPLDTNVHIEDTLFFDNGAYISNEETDTLKITETVTKIEGDLLVTGTTFFTHSGGMTYVSTAGTQTIGTGGTFERLNEGAIAYTESHLHDFTHSDGRLTYTGTVTKHFDVAVYVNIESDEASALVEVILAKGGATITGTEMRHDYRATDTDAVLSFGWLLELATNEYIEVFGTSDQDNDTFFVHNLQMIINEH